jgi:hypothetical protein
MGVDVELQLFLTFFARWKCMLNFTPSVIYPRGKKHAVHRLGGSVRPRARLEIFFWRREVFTPINVCHLPLYSKSLYFVRRSHSYVSYDCEANSDYFRKRH